MVSITPEQFRAALKNVPHAIRLFVMGEELTGVVEDIGKRYNIHIDGMGQLADIITGILLGIVPPAQIEGELRSLGVTPESTNTVVKELNDKVFAPLQEKVKQESVEEAEEAEIAKLDAQAQTAPVPEPTIAYTAPSTPPPTPPRPVMPPPSIGIPTPAPAPVPPPPPTPPSPAYPAPEPSAPVSVVAPAIRTMVHDVESIKTGAAPAPFSIPAPTPAPSVSAPIASTPSSTLPREWAAPVMPPSDTPTFAKTPSTASPVARTATPDIREVTSTLQKYGIDPYRETPE